MKPQVMTTATRSNDIAIIGTACRVAGATSPRDLWESLMARKDAQQDTKARFTGYYDEVHGKQKGLTNVQHAYLIEEGIDRFDNEFFGISPVESAAICPQQRLLLEVTYEALESAGLTLEHIRGSNTAVFAGLFTSDYGTSLSRDIDSTPKYQSTGTSNSIAANRISYFFDLHGPSMVIDTACSSTITALHQAISCVKAGESQAAIVCGANVIMNPEMFVTMSEMAFLSPRGRCHSFDASGDGYARGEGVLAMIIKPLDAAIANNDTVRAVIRGTRLNQDGRTDGITLPSGDAQEKNMRALYKQLGMVPGDVQYFEAHGTGTAVGDPIEMTAIERVFSDPSRTDKLVVGSVKSNCGHLEACAALIGVVKTIECMERGWIPPQLHLTTPNPKINFDELNVPITPIAWPEHPSGKRTAAINSFGFGGANGHLILENYNQKLRQQETERPRLFRISATSIAGLQTMREDLALHIENHRPSMTDLSYTTLFRRSILRKVEFYVASQASELADKLRNNGAAASMDFQSASEPQRMAFVFTGQGAQWAQMSAGLIDVCPTFTAAIEACDNTLSQLPDGPSWSIKAELAKPATTSNINSSLYSQPLCTAVQLGLVSFWRSLGITPHATVGHSSGEMAAAYCAGLLTLEDAIIIAYYRGLHMSGASSSTGSKGAMAAVGMSQAQSELFLARWSSTVDLAAVNSPSSCTLSGDKECIDEIVAACKEQGIFCRKLRVDTAFHSHQLFPCAEPYVRALEAVGVRSSASPTPDVTMYSSVYGRPVSADDLTPQYWARNMTSTVRFADALTSLAQHERPGVLLEVGPHPALKGPAMDTLAAVLDASEIHYRGSLSRGSNDFESLFKSYAAMTVSNQALKVNDLVVLGLSPDHEPGPRALHDLPQYPWNHTSVHWAETRVSRRHRFRKHARHLLLGSRNSNDTPLSMCWRNLLHTDDFEWLQKHLKAGPNSLPPSLCILMVCEAARQLTEDHASSPKSVVLSDVHFHDNLASAEVRSPTSFETQLSVRPNASDKSFSFELLASPAEQEQQWFQLCTGAFSFSPSGLDSGHMTALAEPDEPGNQVLEFLEHLGAGTPKCVSEFKLDDHGSMGAYSAVFSPLSRSECDHELFDWVTGLLSVHIPVDEQPSRYSLHSIDKMQITTKPSARTLGHFKVETQRQGDGWHYARAAVMIDGTPVVSIHGAISKLTRALDMAPPLESLFYRPLWAPDLNFQPDCPLSLDQAVTYLTHKWPSAQIACDVEDDDFQDALLGLLQGCRVQERPRFCSLLLNGSHRAGYSSRVTFAKSFDPQALRLLITTVSRLPELASAVLPGGYVCILQDQEELLDLSDQDFERVCDVHVPTGTLRGVLLRKIVLQDAEKSINPLKVVSVVDAEKWEKALGRPIIDLHSLSRDSNSDNSFGFVSDVIVLDTGPSLLCEMEPVQWLDTLKRIINQTRNLLWVSTTQGGLPFYGATASFIRTLASEHPAMRAMALQVHGQLSGQSFDTVVIPLLESMRTGSAEVEVKYERGIVHNLRYLPDGELAAFTGASCSSYGYPTSTSVNHELTLSAPRTIALCPIRHVTPSHNLPDPRTAQVDVAYSVVDDQDARNFVSASPSSNPLGRYFAGVVKGKQGFVNVVGYTFGAHIRKLRCPSSSIFQTPEHMPLENALFAFTTYSTALDILTRSLRVLPGEIICISWSSPDAEIWRQTCVQLGCLVSSIPSQDVDFVLERLATGYTANRTPLTMHKQRQPVIDSEKLGELWSWVTSPESRFESFALRDVQQAFEAVASTGVFRTIRHVTEHLETMPQLLKRTEMYDLFTRNAVYVIVGGFGGLGRFLMQWMVQQGARNFAIISRSGTSSQAARHAIAEIDALGGSIMTLKVDAGNATALATALETVRHQGPIRGVLNMAMVLENAPFMTMQPHQWDSGIRTKIDTTVSLHKATIDDDLDFFIMFSSVSSISGNRAQSAYAAGNGFQNSMAVYRRSLGLPAVSLALGAMEGIGTLAGDENLLRILGQAGLRVMNAEDLIRCVEAAIMESQHDARHTLVTGFDMFESLDGTIQARADQNQIFWAESAEFSHLFSHQLSGKSQNVDVSLLELIQDTSPEFALNNLTEAFLSFLSGVLGYPVGNLDPNQSIASYGVDSLNAVACRFWFHKHLSVDVPVFDILGSKTINLMLVKTMERLALKQSTTTASALPEPRAHGSQELEVRPLSHSQSRLWFLHNYLQDKTLYNLLLVCHVDGKVNTRLFQRTWSLFVERHEALRTCLKETAEGWQQVISPGSYEYPFEEIYCASSAFQDMESEITKRARQHIFDPARGHLLQGWLLISSAATRFFMASHHLAWDRGSVNTIFEELPKIYVNLVHSRDPFVGLDVRPLQYIDYTIWQQQMLSTDAHISPHVDYWRAQLKNIPESVSLLKLSKASRRPAVKTHKVCSTKLMLGPAVAALIKTYSAANAATPFMFMTAMMAVLVNHLSDDSEIIIGIADGDRGHTAFDRMVGFTVNMLPIKASIQRNEQFSNVLENLRTVCLEAYEHRAAPFDYLLQVLDVPRSTSHNPIFQIIVNYQTAGSFPTPDFEDFKFTAYDHYNAQTQTDFGLEIEETSEGGMGLDFAFDEALYDLQAAKHFARMFEMIVLQVVDVSAPQLLISELNLVPEDDHEFISRALRPTEKVDIEVLQDNLFDKMFARVIANTPQKIALVDKHHSMTYQELDQKTNSIARHLLQSGVAEQARVGICCEANIEMVTAMFGVVRAGCVYVPFDPDFPSERMAAIIEDTDVGTVLIDQVSNNVRQKLIAAGVFDLRDVKSMGPENFPNGLEPLDVKIMSSDVFCSLFTSGSTGRPKGINIGHSQLRYQGEEYHGALGTGPDDIMLLSSSIVFDMSLHPLFGTILHGGTLLIASREERYSAESMVNFVTEHQVSNCIFTPTQFKLMLRAPNRDRMRLWKSLRSLTLGGEAVPVWVLEEFLALELPLAHLFNGYAPTETTIINSLKKCQPMDMEDAAFLPLALPLAPSKFYILDENLAETPVGVPGELYIGGPTVNNGYIKRPDLTSNAFMPDHFSGRKGGLLYRTGDQFCLTHSGSLKALGRISGNRQIKIRGMRVELDEIESVLYAALTVGAEHAEMSVGLCAVVYYPRDGFNGWLAAFVESESLGGHQPGLEAELVKFLRTRLKANLPVHMIPNSIEVVEKLPRTVTGKLDYKEMLSWPIKIPTTPMASSSVSKKSELEECVVTIWQRVLDLQYELTRDDEFFSAGGSSLQLVRIRTEIRLRHNVDISLADMFAYPDVKGMAGLIEAQKLETSTSPTVKSTLPVNEDETTDKIDWEEEVALPEDYNWTRLTERSSSKPASMTAIALTGATGMIGAHLLAHLLLTTDATVSCLAVARPGDSAAFAKEYVMNTLRQWKLQPLLSDEHCRRIIAYPGNMSHPTLGLSRDEISKLDESISDIFHLDSDVSLLKRYDALRRTNVDSLRFLIGLAGGQRGNIKAFHLLSTWAVSHLQSWTATTLPASGKVDTSESEMSHMRPGTAQGLGYLKVRWVGEQLLGAAARRGIPVNIFRASMCAPSAALGCPLPRTDINRRILVGSVLTGLVPDFGSAQKGGMSWIDADFLVRSMAHLAQAEQRVVYVPRIHHLTSDEHLHYDQIPERLGGDVRLVAPEQWFAALRESNDTEMEMQADVLEEWWKSGWVPFPIDNGQTLDLLAREVQLRPPEVTGEFLRRVIGDQPF